MSSSFHPKKKQKISSSFSSSSSSEAKWPFDVFLSFRGEDVRHGFLADLHKCLLHRGINAYIDSEDLRPGDQISPALTKAIEESRIAVLVFSKNYASSRWCLDELVKVMECKELKGQLVLPVFYGVEPREVRGQRESFGKALARHEEKLGKGSERVEKWRQALIEAADLSGWHYDHGDGSEFIEKIVKKISTTVARAPLRVAKYPVGVGCRVEKVMSLLNMGSDDTRIIGIWGTGGVGKTTIANDVYNRIYSQFDGCSFLANVRETSGRPDGLVHLQEKLLREILWKESITVLNVYGGANLIRDRLCCKKILLVLDDVDHENQLNALAGECAWFGKGSRIIITTRDKHVLTSHGIDRVYEVKPLDQDEASELLSSYAFSSNQTKDISMDLIDNILGYANGLPLAIVVLGAFLHGRGRGEWESTLETLAESPNKDTNNVLKISFDALDNNQRDIFLDIACFFKGRKRDYVTRVLDGCGLKTLIGMQTLIERSLVTIEKEGNVQMHDLIELMGQDIVKQEYPDDPGKRSRLWCYNDVSEVLSEDTGTNATKAIVLQLPKTNRMYIGPDAFTYMRRLRMLILINVYNSFQGSIHLPNELRWFEWPNCGSPLEFRSGPKKLVGLDLRNSKIKVMPDQFKDFRKLKFINFSECRSLVCLSSLDHTPNLKELNLSGCKNLERVHESVAYHDSLQLLNLSGCSKLHHLPDVLHSKNLQLLDLSYCSKLQRFPDIPKKIRGLRKLSLVKTSIEELPTSIENLVSLNDINLTNCKKLAILPSSIYRLQNLIYLGLGGCSKLIKFPKKEEDSFDPHMKTGFPKLGYLHLKGCNLSEVEFLENPSCFPNLWSLDVSYCQQLKEIHKIPGQLHLLNAANCKSLRKIPSNIHHLESVYLPSCHELVSNGLTMNDLFNLKHFNPKSRSNFLLPGGEMPQWLRPNKEGYISFTASKELYKKFVVLAVCVVFCREERMEFVPFVLEAFVNGRRTMTSRFASTSSYSDHVWLRHYEPRGLWGGLKDSFGANDRTQFHLIIRATWTGGIVKKCGFRLISKPLEEDLAVLLEDDQLLDPALVYKIQNEDCQTETEEVSLFKLLPDKLMDVVTAEMFALEERCRRSSSLLKTVSYLSWLHKTCMTSS